MKNKPKQEPDTGVKKIRNIVGVPLRKQMADHRDALAKDGQPTDYYDPYFVQVLPDKELSKTQTFYTKKNSPNDFFWKECIFSNESINNHNYSPMSADFGKLLELEDDIKGIQEYMCIEIMNAINTIQPGRREIILLHLQGCNKTEIISHMVYEGYRGRYIDQILDIIIETIPTVVQHILGENERFVDLQKQYLELCAERNDLIRLDSKNGPLEIL